MKYLFSIVTLGLWLCALAQETVYTQAEYDLANGYYQKAYNEFKQSADYYEQAQNFHNYALCNIKMAQCRLGEGKADLAVQLGENTLWFVEEALGSNSSLESRTLSILGEGYLALGRNDLALENLLKEEQLYKGGKEMSAARCYNNLGVVYWNIGNKATALAYHERSLNLKKDMMEEKSPEIADSYINIGLIYLDTEYQKAIRYFNEALDIYISAYGDQHPKVANCYSNLAFAYSYQGFYNEALQYLDLVMDIWESTLNGDHPNKAFTLSSKGRILLEKGDLKQALQFQQSALHQYLRIYGEKHPEVSNCYSLIGKIYEDQGKFELAAEHFQASIYANLYSQSYSTIYDEPELKEYYNADILLGSLQSKAKALEALHYEKTLKPRDLVGALDTYALCDDLITIIRELRLSEADKLRLGKISTDVYNNGIRIALELSRRTFHKHQFMSRAFEFCERSKAAILLEAINETKAKSFAGIPASMLQIEDSLKTEISYLEQKLALSEEKETIKEELFTYKQAYRDFIQQLETKYPEYYKLKYNSSIASVADIQQALGADEALVSYFTGEETIYIFLITQKDFEIIDNPREENFLGMAKGFRNSIKYNIMEVYENASTSLYQQLIPELQKGVKNMVVIPDGILGTLPFEAFKDEEGTYLVQKTAISYDYAATLMIDRRGKQQGPNNAEGILLTAPVHFDRNEMKMATLPGSEEEVKEIKYLFAGTPQKPTVVLKTDANEEIIKSEALQKFRYLHFATHGIVNESKPELSRIFLSPTDGEDGSLYSGEIYNLKINAELVTLSACETGLGKIAEGEGIVGLSRSLMYAGAKNLIVSLWQVSDASTADLMIDFYREHLLYPDKTNFGEDLRSAKLKLISSEKYSSPYYWAPFILVGD